MFLSASYRLLRIALLTIGLLAATSAGAAEQPQAAVSAAELEALVQTIEDDTARAEFLARLKALIAARKATKPAEAGFGARLIEDLSQRIDAAGQGLVRGTEALLDLPLAVTWMRDQFANPATREVWIRVVGKLLVIFALALLGEWATRRLLRRPRHAIEARSGGGTWLRIVMLLARTALDILPILAFAAVAYAALMVVAPLPVGRLVTLTLVNASVLARAIVALGRLVLVPRVASLRLLAIDDETATYAFVWLRRMTNLVVYGYFVTEALLLLGLPTSAHAVLVKLVGLAVGLLAVMLIQQNREAVGRLIVGEGTGLVATLRRRLASIWHILFILYVIAFYGVWALEIPGGFEFVLRASILSVVIVVGAWLAALGLGRVIDRAFRLSEEIRTRLPDLEERANRYLPVLKAVVKGLVYGLAGLGLLQAWGIGVFGWLAGPAGRELVSRLVTIIVIVILALVLWEVISHAIERYLNAEGRDGKTVERSQRVRTLLPLLRNFVMIVLAVLVTLTVLSEIGVDIGPLLAGAGIVGLAIGFGAQTLVKDVITGLFILIEDSVAVGDVVSVAGHTGLVEAMSIRSIRLRDLEGTVRRIPFSEVSSVVNMTKDFSYALLEIGVAYREDVDRVIEVIREVAEELRRDPEQAENILDEVEILGLDRFEDSAVIIRARIKTKPIKQWGVRRAFNRLLKRRFDELGIEIPFPHQTIYMGEDRQGRAPPLRVRIERPEANDEGG